MAQPPSEGVTDLGGVGDQPGEGLALLDLTHLGAGEHGDGDACLTEVGGDVGGKDGYVRAECGGKRGRGLWES